MPIILKGLPGKFRVIGVDTFDGTNWIEKDCDTRGEAIALADERGGTMLKMHVYDDNGKNIHNAGEF